MKVSDYVISVIKELGIKHVFILPGGGAMHLIDSLGKSDIKHITVLHEQAGAIAAQAYAMYTNELAVEIVTSGPGGTNAITGCASAWAESIPVLFISGQAKRETLIRNSGLRQSGSQEVNILAMVKSITKFSAQILEPQDIVYNIQKAITIAISGRPGPVWLDIPVDVQGSEIIAPVETFTPVSCYYEPKQIHMADNVNKTLQLLKDSQKPIILAGYGIQASAAEDEFHKLVRILGIPVLTTWKAIGLMTEDDPLYIGRPGKIGQRGANFAQQNCDLIICIGARLDMEQIAFNPRHFAFKAKKVIVDVDHAEMNKLDMDIDVRIIRDAGEFISALLPQSHPIPRPAWLKRCQEWKEKYPVSLPEYRYGGQSLFINLYSFMEDLSDISPNDSVLVPGSSGQGVEVFMQGWKVKEGQNFVFAPGLGAMGFDIPMALGAAVASDKQVICITGDGGFQLNIQDLETIHRLQLPVKFFVLSNGGYGSIMSMQRNYFEGRYVGSNPESGLTFPDFAKIADAYQFSFYRIRTNLKIKETLKKVLDTPGPVICEVICDPMQQQQPRVSSVINPDGTIESKPMEDLFPFLPRDEFEENMV
jgi:acetolactate synthase-1/2/3 large subunit